MLARRLELEDVGLSKESSSSAVSDGLEPSLTIELLHTAG
jgi:hypothetical protein